MQNLKFIVLFTCCIFNPTQAAQKIISLNLCTDILLIQLAAKSQQLSLTHLVKDMSSHLSIPKTAQFNRGLVEEVILFQPDISIVHTFTNHTTVQRLQKLKIPMLKLKAAQKIEDIYYNLNQVGQAIGRETEARQVIQNMQTQLQTMPQLQQQSVLIFYPNGFTVGQQTLVHQIVARLNLHNVVQDIQFWGKISLEQILYYHPKFIILSTENTDKPALATRLLRHKILQNINQIEVNNHFWQCGSPLILQAMQHISQKISATSTNKNQ